MSQPQSTTSPKSSSIGRIALAVGIIGLVLGASGLGYAVYLGQSQLPSQVSALSVNVAPSNKVFRVDWFNDPASAQDRFFPEFITVAQGDNVTIIFITNDTGDAHTFTMGLALRGLPGSAQFVLNDSATGLSSGPYLVPKETFTGGPGSSCSDRNGNSYACSIQQEGTPTCTPTPCFGLASTGWLGIVTVPGVYKFFCFYHQKGGMIGYFTVLPNKAYTG
jgi:plastocyanin